MIMGINCGKWVLNVESAERGVVVILDVIT